MRLPRKEGLNIIPLVDIMLVLLAIVLSTASFIAQGQIKVNLPESESAVLNKENKKIQIGIDNANNFLYEGKIIDIEKLKSKIMLIDNKTQIELVSDSEARFSSFIEILDILKKKNHENFTIQARIKN
ncbi:TonB system transport protein ExbD [Helicobacter sp. 16-1353]|uniref:TonB system transport protein ExbD n=1 Tax=Helicobacter sp. 16-1353 TaxID=2004996 RepID=UPI000DCB4318|nr:TonB system transport protein ExbD [Helicobacter sp. 16-1353]RAX54749.1 TonB system transport protein ExbD [Helicobacter sp. 16-1353]